MCQGRYQSDNRLCRQRMSSMHTKPARVDLLLFRGLHDVKVWAEAEPRMAARRVKE